VTSRSQGLSQMTEGETLGTRLGTTLIEIAVYIVKGNARYQNTHFLHAQIELCSHCKIELCSQLYCVQNYSTFCIK
jgi:hypothetical protein